MADIIRMTASEMEDLAKQFDNAATETGEMLTNLGNQVSATASSWEGDSYNGFVEKFEEIKGQMEKVAEMYEGIGSLLRGVRDSLIQADSEIASQIRGA